MKSHVPHILSSVPPLTLALMANLMMWGCAVADDDNNSEGERKGESESLTQGLVGGAQVSDGEWDSAVFWAGNGGACSGSVVGPRHLLTAAHCVQVIDFSRGVMFGRVTESLAPNTPIALTHSKTLDAESAYDQNTIERVEMHPAWQRACESGCPYNNATISPFAPDLALITMRRDIAADFVRARVLTGALLPGVPVSIMGYGCEHGVGQPSPGDRRLKQFVTRTVNASYTNHLFSFVPRGLSALFERHYVITPGQDLHGEASLCSGDSGGPLYLTDVSQGEVVVGVNAYYTFRDANGGVSTTNAHTRLGRDNPSGTAEWLLDRLPDESFLHQAPVADFEALDLPKTFVMTLGGTLDADVLRGGSGSDRLIGRAGEDELFGEGGDDVLEGQGQSDLLYGGEGADYLLGGEGADVLEGGPGEDVLMGGPGADAYVMLAGGGHDLVLDDRDGQNQLICQGFDEPPVVYAQGGDWIVMSTDGAQSMRIMRSHIVSFYGCARPPFTLPGGF